MIKKVATFLILNINYCTEVQVIQLVPSDMQTVNLRLEI